MIKDNKETIKTFTHPSLPTPIHFNKSARAKHLRLTIKPTQTITVTVPKHTTLQQAQKFLQSKQAWIQKHLHKLQQQEQLTQDYPKLSQEELNKAQDELFSRLDYFSDKYNLPYKKAVFRNQKTRWGSCSAKNNISLNINIAYLTKELQDYILLHELCHIKHKNHSKKFWAKLDSYVGGRAKLLQKDMIGCSMMVRG